jgi:hypothetical protein
MKKLLTVLVSIFFIQIIGIPSSNADGNFPQGDTNCSVQSLGVYCSVEIVYVNANGATFPTSFIWYYSRYQGGNFNLSSSYGPKVEIRSTDGNGAGFTFEELLSYADGNPNGVIFISVANRWVGTNSSGGALTITNPNGKGTYIELAKLPALIEKARIEASKEAADKAAADKAAAESKAKLDKAAQEATDAANEATDAGNNAKDAADQAIEVADAATIAAQDAAAAAETAGEMAVEAAEAAGVIAQDALNAANAATDAAQSAAEAADQITNLVSRLTDSYNLVLANINQLILQFEQFNRALLDRISNGKSTYEKMQKARSSG